MLEHQRQGPLVAVVDNVRHADHVAVFEGFQVAHLADGPGWDALVNIKEKKCY